MNSLTTDKPYWNTLLRIERRDPDCIETVPKPSLGVTYLSVFQYGHTQFGIEPKSFSLRTHDFPLWDIACPNAYWPVSRYSHAVACYHIETHYRPSIMPSRYTRLWRVLPFAIMRFNMVSYRCRSRLLSDFSAILFQLFSVTSGFSLSLSTDTNHIETHSGNWTQRIEISILHPAGQWPLSLNVFQYGARSRTRTGMPFRARDFKSLMYTISSPGQIYY